MSAFPFTPMDRGGVSADTQPGMTLRDYFAAKAMQGFIAQGQCGEGFALRVARMSFNVADAMLKEREKGL